MREVERGGGVRTQPRVRHSDVYAVVGSRVRVPSIAMTMPAGAARRVGGRGQQARAAASGGHRLHGMAMAYGHLVYRARWAVLIAWAIVLAVGAPFATRLASVLTGGGYAFSGSESSRVDGLLTGRFHRPPSQVLVVFQSTGTLVSDAAYQREVAGFVARARGFAHVTDVTAAGTGSDGRSSLVVVSFDQDADTVQQRIPSFQALLPPAAGNPARAYLTGNPAIYSEFDVLTQEDAENAEKLALPIAFVVLLLVFGSLVSALTPLILALVAVPVALAGVYAIATHTPTSIFVLNIATAVGIGISIDYSLFLVRRFREELAAGRSAEEAVCWTVATAGEAILFSGLAVVIGFLAMLLLDLPLMSSVGLGGALVVGTAALAALTLLPAWLGVLGRRVDALPVVVIRRLTARFRKPASARSAASGGFWLRWALAVMRRPLTVVLLVSALLLAVGWPLLSINLGTPSASTLPASSSARTGLEILGAQFPQIDQNPVEIVAQSLDGASMLTAANLARLDQLDRWLAAQSHVAGVVGLTMPPRSPDASSPPSGAQLLALYSSGGYQQDAALARFVSSVTVGDASLITLRTTAALDSAQGKALIDTLRAGVKRIAGLRVLVGGFQATSLDFVRYLYGNFPRTLLAILLVTYLLLLVLFRSLLLPLKALLMNVLSVVAAYGLLVWAFQWGFVARVLHSTSQGVIDGTIPIVLFCILFGLSMDYEVFLLSRIREEWLRTGDNTRAVAHGLEKTAGVITSAAALFVIVTGSITFGTLILAQESGFGMTVSILVDATVVRTLLVPATMRLMGKWNWWLPRWLAFGRSNGGGLRPLLMPTLQSSRRA